jgi:hypothetical protein
MQRRRNGASRYAGARVADYDGIVGGGRPGGVGILYIGIGALLLLWGGAQFRRGLKPLRMRPFLLVALGALMVYNGLRMEEYLP